MSAAPPRIINLVFILSFFVKRDVGAMSSGLIMCGLIQAPCGCASDGMNKHVCVETLGGANTCGFVCLSVGVMK